MPTADPRRVLVVGGGPAGLESARVAALCGHDVTLVEASSVLGGSLTAARRGPRSKLIGDIVDWLEREVRRAGVDVVLGTRLTTDEILGEAPDAVVVATGSLPRMDGFQPARPFEPALGVHLPHVLSSTQLLTDTMPPGAQTALVLDTTDNFEAITAAEHLIEQGIAVTFLTSHPSFSGSYVQSSFRDVPALEFLYAGDFTVLTRHHLAEITASTCNVRPLQSERVIEVPADIVVLVTQNEPSRQIYDGLVAAGTPRVAVAGDALAPRNLQAAIAEGHRAARTLVN